MTYLEAENILSATHDCGRGYGWDELVKVYNQLVNDADDARELDKDEPAAQKLERAAEHVRLAICALN